MTEPQTFLFPGGLPGEGAFMYQGPVSMDQILPAEQPAVLQPALRFGLQAKGDLSLTSGSLVFPDLFVHLRDGVFDQRQALHQRLVLVCVRWKERETYQ